MSNKQERVTSRKQRGFTLVELLIYTALVLTFLTILSYIFGSIINTQVETSSNSNLVMDGNYIVGRIGYDIYRASAINYPALGANSNSVELAIDGSIYLYRLNGKKLELVVDGVVWNLSGYQTEVISFSVERLGNAGGKNAVRGIVSLKSVLDPSDSKSFSFTGGLR